jgi:hypothetical protein
VNVNQGTQNRQAAKSLVALTCFLQNHRPCHKHARDEANGDVIENVHGVVPTMPRVARASRRLGPSKNKKPASI